MVWDLHPQVDGLQGPVSVRLPYHSPALSSQFVFHSSQLSKMLRLLIIALFTFSFPLAFASPANPPGIAVDQGFTPQWNVPILSR